MIFSLQHESGMLRLVTASGRRRRERDGKERMKTGKYLVTRSKASSSSEVFMAGGEGALLRKSHKVEQWKRSSWQLTGGLPQSLRHNEPKEDGWY